MSGPAHRTPIFVDAAGHRRRWVHALLWSGIAAALVYVALAASALLGGPRIDAPFLPTPFAAASPAPQHEGGGLPAPAPDAGQPSQAAPRDEAAAEPAPAETPAPAPVAAATPAPSSSPSETSSNQASTTGQEARTDNPGSEHRTEPVTGGPERP